MQEAIKGCQRALAATAHVEQLRPDGEAQCGRLATAGLQAGGVGGVLVRKLAIDVGARLLLMGEQVDPDGKQMAGVATHRNVRTHEVRVAGRDWDLNS